MNDEQIMDCAIWIGKAVPPGTPVPEVWRRAREHGFDLAENDFPRLADAMRAAAELSFKEADELDAELRRRGIYQLKRPRE